MHGDLLELTKRNPEREVQGMALPVIDAVLNEVRDAVPPGARSSSRCGASSPRFRGRRLVGPDDDESGTALHGYDLGAHFGLALIARGRFAVDRYDVNGRWAPAPNTCDSLQEAEEEGKPSDLLAVAAGELGDEFMATLDI